MKMVERWRLLTRRRRLTFYGIVTLVASVGVVYAAVSTLFTHTFPAVTVPGVPALVTTNCPGSTLVLAGGGGSPSTASGIVIFNCSSSSFPTFATGTVTVAVSSTGSLPTGYTDLYALPCSATTPFSCPSSFTSCAGISTFGPAVVLLHSNPTPSTTGVTITASSGTGLAAATAYVYCADFVNTSTSPLTLGSFTVTWQQ